MSGRDAARILDADLPRIATALEGISRELHTANLIALAHVAPMDRSHGNYPRRERAFEQAAERLGVDQRTRT
jgi:hypothetical protein